MSNKKKRRIKPLHHVFPVPSLNITNRPDASTEEDSPVIYTILTFAVLSIVVFLPFVSIFFESGSRILGEPRCDNPGFFYYFFHYAFQCWRTFKFNLWTPNIMLGLPYLADGQGAVFHPFVLLLAFLKTGTAINLLIILSVIFSAFGFFGYLRTINISRPAAFCGALTWAFSSAFVGAIYAGHLNRLLGFISLPFMVMFWERFRRDENSNFLLGFAVSYALLILSGFPQSTFIFSLFLLFYIICQSALECGSKDQAITQIKKILAFGVFVFLGIGLGSIQLFPSLDFARESFRSESTFGFCSLFSFAPENLLTLLCPGFFGTTVVGGFDQYWGRNYLWEMWIHVGIVPLIAAVSGAISAPRKHSIVLIFCMVLFFIIGLGKHTPLFSFLYHHVLFFNLFRAPAKFDIICIFCLVTLAAYGFNAWFARFKTESPAPHENKNRKQATAKGPWAFRIAIAFSLAVMIFLITLFFYYSANHASIGSNWHEFIKWRYEQGEIYLPRIEIHKPPILHKTWLTAQNQLIRAFVYSLLTVLICILCRFLKSRRQILFYVVPILLCIELFGFVRPFIKSFDESITRYPDEFLKPVSDTPYPPRIFDPYVYKNQGMVQGTSSIGGYSGNTLSRYNTYFNLAEKRPRSRPRQNADIAILLPLYKMLAVEYIVLHQNNPPADVKVISKAGSLYLVKNADTFPRAFLAMAPRRFDNSEAALKYVLNSGADLMQNPAVETGGLLPEQYPLVREEKINFLFFGSNRIEMDVRTVKPRLLVLNEMNYKDWAVKVNGSRQEIMTANYLFRGVIVPEGNSIVVFEYKSFAFDLGCWASALTGLIIATIFVVTKQNR